MQSLRLDPMLYWVDSLKHSTGGASLTGLGDNGPERFFKTVATNFVCPSENRVHGLCVKQNLFFLLVFHRGDNSVGMPWFMDTCTAPVEIMFSTT